MKKKEIFLKICKKLAEKIPEKKRYFEDLQKEAKEGYLNIEPNLRDITATYADKLERETLIEYVRAMRLSE